MVIGKAPLGSAKSQVRIAARLPLSPLTADPHLRDLEPFRPLSDGAFGLAELRDVSAAHHAALLGEVRGVIGRHGAKACIGVCGEPRVRAVFFDLDSTLIAEETIVELARVAGRAEEVALITERAMRGELDFAAALRERVSKLSGLPERVLDEVARNLTLERGAQDFASFAAELGVRLFVVSGGFTPLVEAVARPLGVTAWRANDLEVRGGQLVGNLIGPIVDAAAKKDFVLEQCEKFGLKPAEVAAVGDGANDLLMLGAVGTAVGFKPKPVLHEVLHAACDDHRFLAPLLFGRGLAKTRSRLSAV